MDDLAGYALVVPALGEQVIFGGVGEGQVPEVVTQGCHPDDRAPVVVIALSNGGDDVPDFVGDLVGSRDHVVDTAGELHDPERVLEALVRGAWVDQVGQRQLVDIPEALEGTGIDHGPLVVVEGDEDVDGVPNFMDVLGHLGVQCRDR